MIATIVIWASAIFGALIALAVLGAFAWHYAVTRERQITELDSLDPRIVGDVTRPYGCSLIRDMGERVEM